MPKKDQHPNNGGTYGGTFSERKNKTLTIQTVKPPIRGMLGPFNPITDQKKPPAGSVCKRFKKTAEQRNR
jgi:hypothetical protein